MKQRPEGITVKPRGVGRRIMHNTVIFDECTEILDSRIGAPPSTIIRQPTRIRVRDRSRYNPKDEDRKHAAFDAEIKKCFDMNPLREDQICVLKKEEP